MKQKYLKVFFFIIFLFSFSNAFSISGEKLYEINELVSMSKFIVHGKVIAIRSYKNSNGIILSDVKIKILKSYKGDLKNNQELFFTFIGGTIGSRTTFVQEEPHFEKKQESILFLNQIMDNQKTPNAFLITGMTQGKYDIQYGKNHTQILRDRYLSSEIMIDTSSKNNILSNKHAILLSEFLEKIESIINNH
jgi:hypothetical protein